MDGFRANNHQLAGSLSSNGVLLLPSSSTTSALLFFEVKRMRKTVKRITDISIEMQARRRKKERKKEERPRCWLVFFFLSAYIRREREKKAGRKDKKRIDRGCGAVLVRTGFFLVERE